ncbi:hypothetical protein Btru_056546 [Bulinus truncatus]|nr:hypothetical protein Btru_056546 [Bulinus truncatus]
MCHLLASCGCRNIFTTRVSSPEGGGEMKDKLAGSKDDSFLPSICDPALDGCGTKIKHATPRKSKSTDETALPSTRMFNNGKKLYSSAPTSESSSPFKLPSIHRSKSNSVSSLVVESKTPRDSSIDRRVELTRSPSCPSLLDFNEGSSHGASHLTARSFYSKKSSEGRLHPTVSPNLKLPNIFQHQNLGYVDDPAPVLTPRGTALVREPNVLTSSPRSSRKDLQPPKPEHRDPYRGQQSYALLLPISSSPKTSSSNPVEGGKRKTQRRKRVTDVNEAIVVTDILKEKLMAIEVRDRLGHSSSREGQERIFPQTSEPRIIPIKK